MTDYVWINELGIKPDLQIADENSIDVGTVWRKRTKLNIQVAHKKRPNCLENVFDIMNHDVAYWLGVLFSDGCIWSDSNRYVISLTSADKTMIYNFKKFIQCTNKVCRKHSKKNDKIYYTIQISNKYIYERLIKYGCVEKKSLIIDRPNIDDEFIWSFMCGIFDGDGSISVNRTINSWKGSIGTGSLKFINFIIDILKQNNIIYGFEKRNNRNIFYIITMCGISARYFLSKCYKNINTKMVLTRKYKLFCKLNSIPLAAPLYQIWERDYIELYEPEIAKNLIENDHRNYGWRRSLNGIKKIKSNL